MMQAALGASVASFLGLGFLFGAAALATGRALARNWRPARQGIAYGLLLGLGHRFLLYALFGGTLLSATGYALAALLLALLALLAHRLTQVRLMLRPYPWLYEPAGPFAWREKH